MIEKQGGLPLNITFLQNPLQRFILENIKSVYWNKK